MAIENTIAAADRPRLKMALLALLVKRGVASIADQAAFGAITFIVSLFIGRVLGAEGLGTYATINALFLLIYSTYDSVLLEPMSVFGPRRSSGARADYRGFLLLTHVAWAVTLAMTSVIAIAAWMYFVSPDPGTLAAVASSIVYSVFIGFQWLLRRHYYIEDHIYRATAQSFLFVICVVSGLFLLHEYGASSVASIYVVLAVSSAVICIVQSLRLRHVVSRPSKTQIAIFANEHWRYGRWVLATVPFYILSFQGYYFLASIVLSIEETGYLKAAETMIGPFAQVVTGLTMMMLPMTSGRIDHMSKPEKTKYLWRILAILLVVAGTYGCLLVLFGDLLVTLAFGVKMQPAIGLLPFAAAIALIWAIATPASLTLSAIKRPDVLFVSFALATLSMVVAGPVLMHAFGREGAMSGMILSWIVVAVTQWWFVGRLL